MRSILFLMLTLYAGFSLAGITSYFGYADDGDVGGFEFQLGSFHTFQNFTLDLNYFGFVMYSGETPSGYRKETFSNGNAVCRDVSTGRFAAEDNCQAPLEFKYAPSIEASYLISDRIALGLGYRAGFAAGMAGLVNLNFFENWRFSIKAGSEYAGLGIGIRL